MVARDASPEERAAYLRRWKAANPQRVRQSNREYGRRVREGDPARVAESQAKYYAANRDARLAANKKWRDRQGGEAPNRVKKARIQDVTRNLASRSRRHWTPEEDLAVMADLTLVEIALSLGRSRWAVEQRRARLRKSNRQGDPE